MKISRLVVIHALLGGLAVVGEASEGRTANRLIEETSPYLRLHAFNPVEWYPWGEEALERARSEDKPIFLSVGYSTCYWCHVMERSVFSDAAIAELMNRWFVNIKVDREERPDIDEIYMTTTQLITGRGGWPNSVFLTPDLKPFFAGTYFPPADQEGRPGFPTILTTLARAWSEQRGQIEAQAQQVSETVEEALSPGSGSAQNALPVAAALRAVTELKAQFDSEWGGFGGAPKFPSPASLNLLWSQAESGDLVAREMVVESLAAMGRGAIYDQLDGGFHRYAVDRSWQIPHFEKMLYDNALLAELLARVSSSANNAELERLTRGTLDFLLEVMQLGNGAFKSAIDAETETVEGAFYIWDRDSLNRALEEPDFRFLAPILGLDGPPNFEGYSHTLYLTDSFDRHAARLGMSRTELLDRVEPLLGVLSRERARRPFPRVDDKVLTDWNGMAVAALAEAGRLLDENRYTAAAARTANFILGLRDADGRLLHVWSQGKAKQAAFLDDYSFLIRGLLKLHRATDDPRWLKEAERLIVEMERQLGEPSGRYFTSPADSTLLVRSSSASGGAIPAGNGVAIVNLLDLAERTGRPIYRARALSAIQSFAAQLIEFPASAPTVALAVLMADRAGPIGEVDTHLGSAVAGPAADLVTVELRPAPGSSEPGWRRFELDLSIRDGWHVNANPASMDLLIPTRIEGDLRAVVYPRGSAHRAAFVDEELRVYTGRVRISGEISIRNPEIQLTYQPCDERQCLPPVVQRIRLAGSLKP